jgi:RNA polymerase sigma-54 factor
VETESGEEVSNREIKQALTSIIAQEDKSSPLSDQALQKELQTKGYRVARRTVSKYREMLQIPVARLRREITSSS